MKKICLILSFFIAFSSHAQDELNYGRGHAFIEKELRVFSDSVQKHSRIIKAYGVYTVHVINTLTDSNSFCFTISYLLNRENYFYPSIHPYFMHIDGKPILLIIPQSYASKWLNRERYKQVDEAALQEIRTKLAPNTTMCHGEKEMAMFWYDGVRVRRKFCENIRDKWERLNYEGYCYCEAGDFNSIKEVFACDSLRIYKDSVNRHMQEVPVPELDLKFSK